MKKVSDNLMEHQIRGLITVLTTVQVGRPFANGVIGFVADSNWLCHAELCHRWRIATAMGQFSILHTARTVL